MKRLVIMLLAFSLLCCPVFADAEEEPCEHFRAWAEWNVEISVETLDGEAHRVTAVCPDCGAPVSYDEAHDYFYASDAEAYDAEQHRTLKTCATCGYAVYEYADHEWQFGEWQSDDGSCTTAAPSALFAEWTIRRWISMRLKQRRHKKSMRRRKQRLRCLCRNSSLSQRNNLPPLSQSRSFP